MITILQLMHKYRGNYELFNLQANLDPQRFRMIVCYLNGAPDGCNRMDEIAAKVIYLQRRSATLRWYNLPLILRLKKLIDDERVQVLNCQQHRTTPLGVMAALVSRTGPATISTLHGLGLAGTRRRRLFNWLLYRYLYRIVGISGEVSRDIITTNWQLDNDKVMTIQNGLEYGKFLSDDDQSALKMSIIPEMHDRFWFGSVGRLSAVKNHQALIEAFALVAQKVPNSILVIAGDGNLRADLEAKSHRLGLSERVIFLGFRRDIPSLLQALDVFVLPSLREGLPLALLEAMASARPVIATHVGGIPEVIGSGVFGRLVKSSDIDALATAMVEFAELSPGRRRELGRQARRRAVEDFNADGMIARYQELYAGAYEFWSRHSCS